MRWASSPAISRTSSTIRRLPHSAPPRACCRNWRSSAAIASAWEVFALSREHVEALRAWDEHMRSSLRGKPALTPAEVAVREEALSRWLQERQITNIGQIAPEFAEAGITPEHLAALPDFLTPESTSLLLSQHASTLRAERMAEAMLDSTARIFDLIRAIKDYSYMDQAPIQEVDVPQSLENTLAMLHPGCSTSWWSATTSPICPSSRAYGSELNQVWTALIENALDAIKNRGHITLRVRRACDLLLVEVEDDGPGIPKDQQGRIFEPFFTTKAPGHGLGLGLDTAQRIVRMHRGYLTVQARRERPASRLGCRCSRPARTSQPATPSPLPLREAGRKCLRNNGLGCLPAAKFVHPKGLSLNSSFQRAYGLHFTPDAVMDHQQIKTPANDRGRFIYLSISSVAKSMG